MITEEKALELLEEHDLPEGIINHSKAVSSRATEIAKRILQADEEVLRIAGLLHDIGKTKCIGNENNKPIKQHPAESGKILRRLGEGRLAKLCESHSPKQLAENSLKKHSLEEKILILSDMQTMEKEQISLDERLEDLISRYPEETRYIKNIKRSIPKYKKIRREINSKMDRPKSTK
ncbi:hypothetical protein C9439_03365 [archaeon SCG-AAA382B04]|nr:hypothetical protein C9439_03365 [archaeon SCG-AAA382B04]